LPFFALASLLSMYGGVSIVFAGPICVFDPKVVPEIESSSAALSYTLLFSFGAVSDASPSAFALWKRLCAFVARVALFRFFIS
jgi:hypothetical protein